jgi:hypothetical protein
MLPDKQHSRAGAVRSARIGRVEHRYAVQIRDGYRETATHQEMERHLGFPRAQEQTRNSQKRTTRGTRAAGRRWSPLVRLHCRGWPLPGPTWAQPWSAIALLAPCAVKRRRQHRASTPSRREGDGEGERGREGRVRRGGGGILWEERHRSLE